LVTLRYGNISAKKRQNPFTCVKQAKDGTFFETWCSCG